MLLIKEFKVCAVNQVFPSLIYSPSTKRVDHKLNGEIKSRITYSIGLRRHGYAHPRHAPSLACFFNRLFDLCLEKETPATQAMESLSCWTLQVTQSEKAPRKMKKGPI